nr:DUF4132 domain-containing protein [Chitinophaga sp. sic0106]
MNGDTWKGFVDNNFRIAYLNRKGKRPKTPPTAASKETKKFFKELQKQLPAMAAQQAERLQQFLVNQRSWKAAQWLELFLQNPLMFVFANRLIWAVYDEENQLMTSLRCTEDARLITISGAAIELPPFATVRLLHPLQMDAAMMDQWKQHLTANNITPAFEQLDRQVTTLQPEQRMQTMITDFEDIAADQEVIQQHLLSRGWQPQTNEEGVAHTWYKSNDIQQVEARIATYNIYQESGIRCKLGNLYFTRQLTTEQISSAPTTPADLLQLYKVPPVFFSETVTDIALSRVKMELV